MPYFNLQFQLTALLSIYSTRISNDWKTANIVSIHKKGSRSDPGKTFAAQPSNRFTPLYLHILIDIKFCVITSIFTMSIILKNIQFVYSKIINHIHQLGFA